MAKRSKQLSEHLLVFFNDIRSAEHSLYDIITSDENSNLPAFTRCESSKINLSSTLKASKLEPSCFCHPSADLQT